MQVLDAYGPASEKAPELLLDPFVPNSHLLLFYAKSTCVTSKRGGLSVWVQFY